MKVIHYGQDQLVTGDAIAQAVVRYAQELAIASLAATIDIPIRNDRGEVIIASILLGPSSQLVALPFETSDDELVDDDVVAGLTMKATQIGPKVAHPTTAEMASPPTDFETDW